MHQSVHAILGGGRNQGRLAQNEGEDLMARGDLGQMDIRFQADLLQLGDLIGRQLVVEVVRDHVGIERVGSGGGRRRDTATAGDLLDAGDQLLRRVALGDFLADF